MDFTRVLSVAIGLFATFFVLSVVASHVVEVISGFANLRGRRLYSALEKVIDGAAKSGKSPVEQIFDHPLIATLSMRRNGTSAGAPTYIEAAVFARTVTLLLDDADSSLSGIEPFKTLKAEALRDGAAIEARVQDWFRLFNDRLTGTYIRVTTLMLLGVGVVLAVILNIDAIALANGLLNSPQLDALVGHIDTVVKGVSTLDADTQKTLTGDLTNSVGEIIKLQQPSLPAFSTWPGHMLGWAITAIAVSLGAQFWFKLLREALKIRQVGLKPDDEASADGASPDPTPAAAASPPPPAAAPAPAAASLPPPPPPPPVAEPAAVEGSPDPDDDASFQPVSFNLSSGDELLGTLSSKYEVGGRGPGTVSSGNTGDPGGVSSGSYQLSTSRGSVKAFLGSTGYQGIAALKALQPGTPGFTAEWKRIAVADPKGFFAAQHAYIEENYYRPQVAKVKSEQGLDLDDVDCSNALRNAVWSTAVQHGGATSIVCRVLGKFTAAKTPGNAAERALIEGIYDERGRKDSSGNLAYFKSSSRAIQNSVTARFVHEKTDALAMYDREKGVVTA